MLEGAAPSILFHCENQLRFSKEHFLYLMCFKVDIGSVCSNYDFSGKLNKNMNLSKRIPSVLEA
jgi:hypothetical protein